MTTEELSRYSELTALEKNFRKIRTVVEIERKWKALGDAHDYKGASLLMVVRYGTKPDVEKIKNLIIEEEKTVANLEYDLWKINIRQQILLTDPFVGLHIIALDNNKTMLKFN